MKKVGSIVLKYSGVVALALVVGCMATNYCCKKKSVAVLDHQKILTTAAPFQSILGEERKYLNAVAARRVEDEKMLQTERVLLQKKIKESGKKPEAFQKELAEFQQKVAFYNEKYRVLNELVARASQIARQQLDPYVHEVLNEMGKQGVAVILPKQAVTYNVPCVDMTAQFIERLNAKDVKIAFPDPAQLAVSAQAQNNQAAPAAEAIQNAPKADANQTVPAKADVKEGTNSEKTQQKSAAQPTDKKQKSK